MIAASVPFQTHLCICFPTAALSPDTQSHVRNNACAYLDSPSQSLKNITIKNMQKRRGVWEKAGMLPHTMQN